MISETSQKYCEGKRIDEKKKTSREAPSPLTPEQALQSLSHL